MTDFRPFRAVRYDGAKVDMQKVIAPPYDIISPSEQDALYEREAHNCIRLILNRITPQDSDTDNRYTRSRAFFEAWKKEGVLRRDSGECFYLYRQTFADPEDGRMRIRTAVLGRLRLEPFEKGIVIPHEKTLAKPRADRESLLRATRTNFSPIFGLYEDGTGDVTALLGRAAASTKPLFDVPDDAGVRHQLTAVSDPQLVRSLSDAMRARRIYIADGHHRYTTALKHAGEERVRLGAAEGDVLDSDYVLMALVEFHDPGLALFPTHRIVSGLENFDSAAALKGLGEFFDVTETSAAHVRDDLAKAPASRTAFGLLFPDGTARILTVRDTETVSRVMPGGHSVPWYALDVTVLAHAVMGHLWHIPEERWESVLSFTHDDREALAALDQQETSALFFLRKPRVEILSDMGKTGELLPQKSTYFYPKLASGLVFYSHE